MARLTEEQWKEARRRWESDPRDGFDWLSKELGGVVSRQAISKRAGKEGWTKGGKPEPVAQPEKKVAQPRRKVAQPRGETIQPEPEFIPDEGPPRADAVFENAVNPVGRPTDYRPEFARMILQYFQGHEAYREEVELTESGSRKRIWIVPNRPRTLTHFATLIGVYRQRLYEWASEKNAAGRLKHPEFADAFMRARGMEEAILLEGALTGAFNPGFTAFVMQNLHGYRKNPADAEEEATADTQEDRAKREAALERALDNAALEKERMLERAKSLNGKKTPAKLTEADRDESDDDDGEDS